MLADRIGLLFPILEWKDLPPKPNKLRKTRQKRNRTNITYSYNAMNNECRGISQKPQLYKNKMNNLRKPPTKLKCDEKENIARSDTLMKISCISFTFVARCVSVLKDNVSQTIAYLTP